MMTSALIALAAPAVFLLLTVATGQSIGTFEMLWAPIAYLVAFFANLLAQAIRGR